MGHGDGVMMTSSVPRDAHAATSTTNVIAIPCYRRFRVDDVVMVVVLIVIAAAIEDAAVPFRRVIFNHDLDISYPYTKHEFIAG